ncbi:MAG: hypothetical protein ACI94Y_004526, partial [Maribacter sp.]
TSFDGDKELYYWKSARRLVDYTHLQKFVTLGGAEITRSYDELEKSISTYINNPDHRIENRKNALHSECYQDDGKSTDRVIDAMLHLLEKLKV